MGGDHFCKGHLIITLSQNAQDLSPPLVRNCSILVATRSSDTTSLLFAHVRILMDSNERNNRMPPIRCGPRIEPWEISCCLIFLPAKNSHRLKQK